MEARLRNLGIVAHIDAGKTTLTERFLFFSGVESRLGEVDDGTTVMDWMEAERERGITIAAAATSLPWAGYRFNLIDTPGHVDFTVEVERCMRVLDGAVLVIDAVEGVQAQSETVWRQMQRHRVPAIAFVNKCDRPAADYLGAVASLHRRLEVPAIAVQFPFVVDANQSAQAGSAQVAYAPIGVVDLLTGRALVFPRDPVSGASEPVEVPVPASVEDEVGVLRAELVEQLAEADDDVMTLVLDEREPGVELLKLALRKCTLAGELIPVLAGSARRNAGVQLLMDAVIDYLPAPDDVVLLPGAAPLPGAATGSSAPIEYPRGPEAPLLALVFKLQVDGEGELVFLRIYAGTLAAGDEVENPRTQLRERVESLVRIHADACETLAQAGPGDIVGVRGLRAATTGDTLSSPGRALLLEPPAFPEPVITLAVEPRTAEDRERLRGALARLAREDPSFHQREDEQTGQWQVSGMGELHLEVALHRLTTEFGVRASASKPRVAYREAPSRIGRGSGRVERNVGSLALFGAVELELRPRAADGDLGGAVALAHGVEVELAATLAERELPAAFREAVVAALRDAAQVGPRCGYPLVNAVIVVTGGESNPEIDAELGFVQAALQALRQATTAAAVEVLEPIMRFEVESPEVCTSAILADLNARRATVEHVGVEERLQSISGQVPLAQMFGYASSVRSQSQGRASHSMRPAGFRAIPEAELEARGLTR